MAGDFVFNVGKVTIPVAGLACSAWVTVSQGLDVGGRYMLYAGLFYVCVLVVNFVYDILMEEIAIDHYRRYGRKQW